MPQAVAYVLAAAFTDGAITAGVTIAAYAIVIAATVYVSSEQQRKAQNAAKDAYNNSLRDRYVMSRGATEPRQLVLGRQRVSGPMFFVKSFGASSEGLVFTVALAGHEIDAVEAIYFDNQKVLLDGSGYVTGVIVEDTFSISAATGTFVLGALPIASTVSAYVRYGTTQTTLTVGAISGTSVALSGADPVSVGTVTISYQPQSSQYAPVDLQVSFGSITLDASGNGIGAMANVPYGAYSIGGVAGYGDLSAYSTISGSTITVTGAPVHSQPVQVFYHYNAGTPKALVKWHLGAPGQSADSMLITAVPSLWTSADTVSGVAYLAVQLAFSPDAFPNGIPNISALIRGAKVYDPRSGATAWSENPALLFRAAATSDLCGRLDSSLVDDTAIAVAANACDVSATYVVNGQSFVRPFYTAGLVVKSGSRGQDALNDLAKAMAGKWTFVDGLLRVKAGAYTTPVMTLDDSWLIDKQQINIQPHPHRADLYNVVTGKFIDEQNDYQALDYPEVDSGPYIAEDGVRLPLDVPLNAVTFRGQTQQVIAAQMRDARQGLTLTVLCNMNAYPVETFDIINVTLDRFGWLNKPFEVFDISWTPDGGIQLQMKETDPGIWALGTDFPAFDPAPNTLLPSPFLVADITSLTAQSGTAQLLLQADGTILTRVLVTWDAMNDEAVNAPGGGVEVRYGVASTDPDTWISVKTQPGETQCYLTGCEDNTFYLIHARAHNSLVNGKWCPMVLHYVQGKLAVPVNVASLSETIIATGVRIDWVADTEPDYAYTELRVGSTWSTASPLFKGRASTYTWLPTTAATYTILAKHFDTSGNQSTTATSVTASVTASILAAWRGNATFVASSAPTAGNVGDTWLNTTDGRLYVWNGSAWAVQTTVGVGDITTALLASAAATDVFVNNSATPATVTQQLHEPDGLSFNTQAYALTFTPLATGTAVATISARGYYSAASGHGFSGYGSYSLQNAAVAMDVSLIQAVSIPEGTSIYFPIESEKSFSVTAGTSYTIGLYCAKLSSDDVYVVDNRQFKVEVIKR